MQFKQGVGVRMIDGRAIGKLDRVVVDPRTKEVNYIVVRKGTFFTTDKLVPLNLIAGADDQVITLREDAGDLEQLPDFEERYYVPADDTTASPADPPGSAASAGIAAAQALYPYPPAGGTMGGPPEMGGQGMMGAMTVPQPVVERTQRAIPDDSVALRPGEPVLSADGQQVGSVEQVLTAENADQVSHFIISQGTLFKDRKLIPMGWVSDIGEERVQLAVDATFLGKLPAYNPPS
jgi:uncharacterized protein YrrD